MQVNYWPRICRGLTRCSARFFHCSLYSPWDSNTRTNTVSLPTLYLGSWRSEMFSMVTLLLFFIRVLILPGTEPPKFPPNNGYTCRGLGRAGTIFPSATWPVSWLSDCLPVGSLLLKNGLVFSLYYVCLLSWKLLHSRNFWVPVT